MISFTPCIVTVSELVFLVYFFGQQTDVLQYQFFCDHGPF